MKPTMMPTDGDFDFAGSDELLPCPFCGGEAEIDRRDVEPQGDPWYGRKMEVIVKCRECAATVFDGFWHEGFVDAKAAAEAWNRRTALSPEGH